MWGAAKRRISRMGTVSVRYIVDGVEEAISFYCEHLGFEVEMHPAPGFAMLSRGDLRLLLNTTSGPGGASQPMPDGRRPEPGGWNRFQLEVSDLASVVDPSEAQELVFVTRSSTAWAASRSWSRTLPATP
jgi:catechol 2,3-dioxygenase-like lactoylglutathione lyase family enzyme